MNYYKNHDSYNPTETIESLRGEHILGIGALVANTKRAVNPCDIVSFLYSSGDVPDDYRRINPGEIQDKLARLTQKGILIEARSGNAGKAYVVRDRHTIAALMREIEYINNRRGEKNMPPIGAMINVFPHYADMNSMN